MGNKNALGTKKANDFFVVTPENMGKGLLYDPQTKTYYVAIDEKMFQVDELGRLKLRVSSLEDNMLKLRDDGLYQGNTARPDLANLYVANHGNDSNAGTREAPLHTIQEAINRLEDIPATYHIWVHEGHSFDWVSAYKKFANIIFNVYGNLVDSTYPMAINSNAYYRGYTAKNFPRPTINVRTAVTENFVYRHHLECNSVTMRGFRVDVYNKAIGNDDGTKSGNFGGFVNCADEVVFHGSILNEKTKAVPVGSGAGAYRDDVIIRSPIIRWIDSVSETLPVLASSNYTTQLSVVTWNSGYLQGNGEKPNHEALVPSDTAFQVMTKGMRQKLGQVVFDDSTKTVFGMNLNWDIFAIS